VHQAVYACKKLDRVIENTPLIYRMMKIIEQTADATIGQMGLALMQYVALEKNGQQPPVTDDKGDSLKDILMCPHCHSFEFTESPDKLQCVICKKSFSTKEGIYDFRT